MLCWQIHRQQQQPSAAAMLSGYVWCLRHVRSDSWYSLRRLCCRMQAGSSPRLFHAVLSMQAAL